MKENEPPSNKNLLYFNIEIINNGLTPNKKMDLSFLDFI